MDSQETISFEKFFEMRFKAAQEHTDLRFDALDKALLLAAKIADDKYEHLNNLKEEVTRDKEKFATKSEVQKDYAILNEKVDELKDFRTRAEGAKVEHLQIKAQSNWSTGLTIVTILSSLSLIVMIIHLFFSK